MLPYPLYARNVSNIRSWTMTYQCTRDSFIKILCWYLGLQKVFLIFLNILQKNSIFNFPTDRQVECRSSPDNIYNVKHLRVFKSLS